MVKLLNTSFVFVETVSEEAREGPSTVEAP